MIRVFFSVLLVLAFSLAVHAQDIIYTTGGNKITAKVTELNTTDVKYKDFANLEGPTYVISKVEVVLIQFSDGSSQIINENPPSLEPKKPEEKQAKAPVKKKDFNLYYLNKNLLSINALALANGDVTLLYDRELLDSKLCLTFLGGYNFNPNMGGLNGLIANAYQHTKKNYDAGFGISFMPRNTRRVQYFVGLLAKYMSYNYEDLVLVNSQSMLTVHKGSQVAVMLNNGWVFRITPNLNFKFFGAIGVPINTPKLTQIDVNLIPKVYLGYCFGYRF